MRRALVVVAVALMWGCSAGTGGGTEPDVCHDATGRCVVVTRVDTYHFDGVDEAAPRDISKLVVGAFVDGGFNVLPVEAVDAGVARIQPAPEGPLYYYVQFDPETYFGEPSSSWIVSNSNEVHLGCHLSGRANAERGDPNTQLDVTWSGTDAGYIEYSFPSVGVDPRWAGEGSLLEGVPLPKPGDDIWFFEYQSRDSLKADGGTQTQTILANAWSTNSLSIAQGQRTSISVPLAPVTSVATYKLDVRNEEFALEAQKADPRVTSATSAVVVDAVPDMQGRASVAVRLTGFDTVETLQVPDPFQGTWLQSAVVSTTTLGGGGAFFTAGTVEMLKAPIRPVVGIPTDVRVDGAAPGSTVSNTPVVTWTAPALGPATYYTVRIDTGTLSSFRTTATQLRIPPRLLHPGGSFTLKVRAWQAEEDVESHPFDYALTRSLAETELFRFSTQ